MALKKTGNEYGELLDQISGVFSQGQVQALRAINVALIDTYWQVGRHIVEFEQAGQKRAVYGKALLEELARDLKLRHGRGFSRSNLSHMRQFFLRYPDFSICEKASHKLSWSHYVELLKLDDDLERQFYEKQTIAETWSVPELKRQKNSQLFLRLAASKDKAGVLQLAQQGQLIEQPADLLREPYVFEFLKIPEPHHVSETLLCDHLQPFLLELGKGFTFVGRQYRINVGGTHYRVDLVFYHRILRRFVLIDLKLGEVQHHDIGQMNLYLGYFAAEENTEGDQPPVGIILSRQKDELLVEYATCGMNSQLFVQKYLLYLPDRDALRAELERVMWEAGR